MATVTERRVIVVDVKGSAAAVAHMKELQKAAKNVDNNIGRMQKTLASMGNTMKAFIAYRATAYLGSLANSFLESADSMTNMYARLDLVNDSMETTASLMSDLFDVAERSRGSIESVTTLYTRLAASTKDLNVEQQDLLDFTELVSDTFILSGASAGEAASGVTQISQAMAKGKLDGDEFKSIMENNVYFAGLLAESLGVTRGELQEMSKEGQITTERLLGMSDSIDSVREKMASMPVTVSQAVTAMDNAWKRMIGSNNALSLSVGKALKYISDQANEMISTFEKMTETDIETQFQNQRKILNELKSSYAETAATMEAMADGLRAADENGADPEWIKTYNTKMIAMGVTASNLLKRIEELRAKMGLGLPVAPTEETPTPSGGGGVSARQKSLNDYRKSLTESQSDIDLFASKMRILDELFFKEDITESVWNTELEKLTGNLGEATGQLSAFDAEIAKMREDQMASTDMLFAANEAYNNQKITLDELITIQDRYAESAKWANEQAFGEEAQDSIINWKSVAETAIGGITGSLIDMAVSGKNSFEDFAKSFLLNISKMIAQQIVLNALKNSTVFGGLFADGGVINNGVQAFASGGIVNTPTIFPLASGAGIMGEAGPEGILPLSRGANGKLGVQAEGMGAGNVTIIQNINGNGDEALARAVQEGAQRGYQMSVNDVKRNGPMRRQMGV